MATRKPPFTPLEHYRENYFLSSVMIEEDPHRMIVDQHQRYTLDLDQPIYLLDLDHTLLNTSELKDLLRHSLSEFNISAEQYEQAYQQAKDDQNFYDFHKHLELISQLIAPEHPVEAVPNKVRELLYETINRSVKSLVYTNMATWLKQTKPRNVIIDTSGTGEWQRQKVAACLVSMDWQPQAVVLIENVQKGWVIEKLHQLVASQDTPSPSLIVLDDNAEQVHNIALANQQLKFDLKVFRVKQPGGQYNDDPTRSDLDIQELDFVAHPDIDIAKVLST